jgi:toxin CcdB
VIVAPLAATSAVPGDTRLHPSMTIAGQRYFMLTEDLAAMPRGDLGPVVGSAVEYRYEIIGALDLLFTGI